jgi:hypothetical protein
VVATSAGGGGGGGGGGDTLAIAFDGFDPHALRAGSRDLGMTEVRTPSLARRHLSNIEAGPSEPMRVHLKPDQAGIAHLSCVEMPDTLT